MFIPQKTNRGSCTQTTAANRRAGSAGLAFYIALLAIVFSLLTPGLSAQDPMQDFRLLEPDTLKHTHVWTPGVLKDQFMMHPDRKSDGWWFPHAPQQHKPAGWNIERVHSGKFFDHMGDRSLTLDAGGNPHIAYGGKHLYYAWYDGTEWHIDTVDDSWDVGYCTSLAFDSGGYPHISYYDRDPNGNLKYAYRDVSGWHIQTVDSSDNSVGLYTSLAIDADGHVHISYSDATDGNLKYARLQAGQWQLQTVDNDEYVGLFTSIALDPHGWHAVDPGEGGLLAGVWRHFRCR